MKHSFAKLFLSISCAVLLFSGSVVAQTVTVTIKSSFIGVQEGYDHDNRNIIYIDGKKVGKSKVTKETEPNIKVIKTTVGSHVVRVENWAHYIDGKKKTWEMHIIDNGYSIDCLYKEDVDISTNTNRKLTLIFDIDSGTSGDWE